MLNPRLTESEKHSRKRLYSVWYGMISRCENPGNRSYKNYGARGIKVCEEWHDFDEFFYWAIAHDYDGDAPQGQCTIDRIDNDGNYEPGNCRFTNMMMQSWNKRPSIRKRDFDEHIEDLATFMDDIDSQLELRHNQERLIQRIAEKVTREILAELSEEDIERI